jgi:multisubunit Na+/H+ antiporter MnhG subunit
MLPPPEPFHRPPDYRRPLHAAAWWLIVIGAVIGAMGYAAHAGWLFLGGLITIAIGFFLFAPVWFIFDGLADALINFVLNLILRR